MSSTLITGIGELVTNDPDRWGGSPLGILRDAAVVIDDEKIMWVGPATGAPEADRLADQAHPDPRR